MAISPTVMLSSPMVSLTKRLPVDGMIIACPRVQLRPPSWLELALAVMVALMAAKALTASVRLLPYWHRPFR